MKRNHHHKLFVRSIKKGLYNIDEKRNYKNAIESEPWGKIINVNNKTNFIHKIYAKPTKKKKLAKKTDVYYIDATCRLDLLDLNDNGPKRMEAIDKF